jgi:hypothetical protein
MNEHISEHDRAVADLINQAWEHIQETRWMFKTDKDFHRGVWGSAELSVMMQGMYR